MSNTPAAIGPSHGPCKSMVSRFMWRPSQSGLKLRSRAATIARLTATTPIQSTKWKTSRITFKKLETEPGPKARIASSTANRRVRTEPHAAAKMTLTGSAAKRIRRGLADEQADGRQRQAHEHDGVHHGQGETINDVDQTGGLHDLISNWVCACGAGVEAGFFR